MARPTPLPLFNTLENIKNQKCHNTSLSYARKDFAITKNFLLQYDGSIDTFNSYRRELERLIQWSWLIQNKSITRITRDDIEQYLKFCKKPLKSWIGLKREKRFILKNGKQIPNKKWRPFVATVSKSDFKNGITPDKSAYQLSQKAMRDIFSILSSFYGFLLIENIVRVNPIAQIKQKSKFIQKQQQARTIRRLSDKSWQSCIETARKMAVEDPAHERTLFIISSMYYMYLRISELVATERWTPQMGHFYQDSNQNWWFKTVGKGNKMRDIAVCKEMLQALSQYRGSLNLASLPSPNEQFPLIPKIKGTGGITNTRQIRRAVQACYDRTIKELKKKKSKSAALEAQSMEQATVHWLRHAGISDDINKRHRPIPHVRDDAGHSSSQTTDRYNDVTLQERHKSAESKE